MKKFLVVILAGIFFFEGYGNFSVRAGCEQGLCSIKDLSFLEEKAIEVGEDNLKEWIIPPGKKMRIKLGRFSFEIDNTAGVIIFHGGGVIRRRLSNDKYMETPVVRSRRQEWLIDEWKKEGYRVEFFTQKGVIHIHANRFLINQRKAVWIW